MWVNEVQWLPHRKEPRGNVGGNCIYKDMSQVRLWKGESSVEQIGRSLRAKLKEVSRLVCKRWHKECNRYYCLSVGFV